MTKSEIIPFIPAVADARFRKLRTTSDEGLNVSATTTQSYQTFEQVRAAAASDPTLALLWDRLFDDDNP